jgi:hypothetical protein
MKSKKYKILSYYDYDLLEYFFYPDGNYFVYNLSWYFSVIEKQDSRTIIVESIKEKIDVGVS